MCLLQVFENLFENSRLGPAFTMLWEKRFETIDDIPKYRQWIFPLLI